MLVHKRNRRDIRKTMARPITSPFIISDVAANDIIIVRAPFDDETKWAFEIPGFDTKVWVARVTEATLQDAGTQTYMITGYFAWNPEKDLTKPMQWDDDAEAIFMEETSLFGVYADEATFKLTKKDMNALKRVIRSMEPS
jgi:hypothetical protein